jgi:hypothetical protein
MPPERHRPHRDRDYRVLRAPNRMRRGEAGRSVVFDQFGSLRWTQHDHGTLILFGARGGSVIGRANRPHKLLHLIGRPCEVQHAFCDLASYGVHANPWAVS